MRLRPGTRTGHRAHRVGDQAGAHHADQKGRAERNDLGPLVTRRRAYDERPRQLVEDWARALHQGQPDAAAQLYAPDAVIHTREQTLAGGRDIRRHLDVILPARARMHPDGVGGLPDGRFRVHWTAARNGPRVVSTVLRICDGRIVEQGTASARSG